jgi:F0F1-type ATP synthase beta subunit
LKIKASVKPIQKPARNSDLKHVVELLPEVRARGKGKIELLETGVKVIDLLCPYMKGGKVGLFGDPRVGKLVFVEEVVRRLARRQEGVAFFTFFQTAEVSAVREALAREPGYTRGKDGSFQSFCLVSSNAADPQRATSGTIFDALIYFTRELVSKNIWPAVDPLISTSRIVDRSDIVGDEHRDVARRVRHMLKRAKEVERRNSGAKNLSEENRSILSRARKIQKFLAQPFFIAEPYTHVPGKVVPREETIRTFKQILDGSYDDLPEEAFYFVSGIDEVLKKANTLSK